MASRRMETKPVITCLKTLLIVYSFVFWVSTGRVRLLPRRFNGTFIYFQLLFISNLSVPINNHHVKQVRAFMAAPSPVLG